MVDSKIKFNKFFAILILLFALAPILPEGVNTVFLFVIMPVMLVFSVIQYPNYIRDNTVFRRYFIYFVFSLLTIIWANDRDLSFTFLRLYAGAFVIVYVLSSYSTNEKYLRFIRVFYFLYLAVCLGLGFTRFGFANVDLGSERVGGVGLNSNRFGYFIFFITFYIYYLAEIRQNNKIWRIRFFFMIPLTFYISLITASRQILIIQVPYIAFLLMRRYSRKINIASVLLVFALLIVALILSDRVISVYESSFLAERMSGDIGEDSRTELIRLGFKIGYEHFFTGVGFANFRLYSFGNISHCTYAEAFAEGGIIQLLLFLSVLVSFSRNQLKRYSITKDNAFIILFVTGLFYAVFNLFFVFPSYALIMAFIFVIESESVIRLNHLISK